MKRVGACFLILVISITFMLSPMSAFAGDEESSHACEANTENTEEINSGPDTCPGNEDFCPEPSGPVRTGQTESALYINPIYESVVKESDFEHASVKNTFGAEPDEENLPTFNTFDEAGAYLKEQVLQRNPEIFFNLLSEEELEFESSYIKLFSYACEHTGIPTEGDYIRFEYGGYNVDRHTFWESPYYRYEYVFKPLYYTTEQQENVVDSEVAGVLSKLNLGGKTLCEKIRTIYKYLCDTVTYDYKHLSDKEYKLKYTAYAALVNHTAVCQGFSTAFYRLCLESGIDARIIKSVRMNHAWNIAGNGTNYFEFDTTWDAGKTDYQFAFRGSDYWLKKHTSNGYSTIGDQYTEEIGFAEKYKLTAEDSTVAEKIKSPTCTESGNNRDYYYCVLCGRCFLDSECDNEISRDSCIIAPLGHAIILHAAKKATCTEKGWDAYDTCTRCDYTTYKEIKALGHDIQHHAAKTVTCTEKGWDVYDTCSRCGYTTYKEIPALGHNLKKTEAKEATESAAGNTEYWACFACGKHFSDSEGKNEMAEGSWIIPAKGPMFSGSAHVQTFGDKEGIYNGKALVLGTTGQSKRLESIIVNFNNTTGYEGDLVYRVHCQTYGWLDWTKSGNAAGTHGESKRLEAIEMKLTGELAEHYSIRYKVHVQNIGNQNWRYDGELAGTEGQSLRLENLTVELVPKNEIPTEIRYRVHRQTYGWEPEFKTNGQTSGTTGESKRLEGIYISLRGNKYSGGITYRTHVQTYGWQGWKTDNQMSGTTGESKRLEAIEIKLTGEMAKHYDVYYRVHAQHYGWLGWAKNGESSGTAGYSYRLEAIQIVLVEKGGPAPGNIGGIVSNYSQPFYQA